MSTQSDTAALVLELTNDPVLANRLLFPHRHPVESAAFHPRMIAAYMSALPQVLVKAFRGSAKSTTAEEVMVQGAVFGGFRYGLIVGSTYDRAVDRLATIKRELEFNPKLLTMFGGLEGSSWGAEKLILANGCMLRAIGRGQSARGLKEETTNSRPDFAFFDDLEEEETGDHKRPVDGLAVWRWITRVLVPAMAEDRQPRIRWAGTPLGENSALEMAAASPDWRTLTVPLYVGDLTERDPARIEPTWPALWPAGKCLALRDRYERAGDLAGFSQEFLCRSIDNQVRPFRQETIHVVSPKSSFRPKTLIVDPARTTNAKSARTGYVVTSWLGNVLQVHHAQGAYHTPAEQVTNIFDLARVFNPGLIAVEKDGLEEWLMQPLRAEMVKTGDVLPIEGIRAPKDKIAFIGGLQPFFNAGEVLFARDFPDLTKELLAFPYGLKDIANALAYAVRLRPGSPIYPGFTEDHIQPFVPSPLRATMYLAMNATPGLLAAALVAVQDGRVHVLRDWVREGTMADMLQVISMDIGNTQTPTIVIPGDRASPTDGAGLGVALQRAGARFVTSARTVESVECLTDIMRQTLGGLPRFTVAPDAVWTLNALAGGYCREATGAVILAPKDGISKTIAQALETLGRTAISTTLVESENFGTNALTRGGSPFRSLRR